MSSTAADVQLIQTMQLLTKAVESLNTNMFASAGGRGGYYGSGGNGSKSGQGVNTTDGIRKDSLKQTSLLNKALTDNTSAIKFLVKNQSENIKNLSVYTAAAGKFFNTTLQKFSATQLNSEIPKKLNTYLDKQLKTKLFEPLTSYGDVLRLTKKMQADNIERAYQYQQQLVQLGEKTELNAAAYEKLLDKIEETGVNLEELSIAARGGAKGVDDLKKQYGEVAAELSKVAAEEHRVAMAHEKLTSVLKAAGAAVLTVGSVYLNAAHAAANFATEFSDPIKAAFAGLRSEDLAQVQHENWLAIQAGTSGVNEFNTTIGRGARDLLSFTGDLGTGAKLTASFLGNFRSMSSNTQKQNGFMQQQAELFKDLNRTFSITAEQFTELNSSLMQSSAVQANLYKLDQNRRVAYYQDLQQMQKRLLAYGLETEQVKQVTETLAQLGGKPAVSRIETAAKIQAIGGALGMGPEATELAGLIRGGLRGPRDKERAAALAAKLQRGTAGKYQGASNIGGTAGLGIEAALDSLTAVSPEVFGTNSPTAALALSQGKQITTEKQAQLKTTDYLGNQLGSDLTAVVTGIIGVQNVMKTAAGDIVKAIWAAGATYLGVKGLGDILSKGLAKRLLGAGGRTLLGGAAEVGEAGVLGEAGLAGAGGLGVGAAGLGSAALATGGVAAAGALGYGLGTYFTDILPKQLGADRSLGEVIGGGIYDLLHPDMNDPAVRQSTLLQKQQALSDLKDQERMAKVSGDKVGEGMVADQIAKLTDEVKKLQGIQTNHLDATKKQTAEVKKGVDQAAAQNDDLQKVTKERREFRDTHRVSTNT